MAAYQILKLWSTLKQPKKYNSLKETQIWEQTVCGQTPMYQTSMAATSCKWVY